MEKENSVAFQFISEPSDVNFGGKVHGGAVMKWIDQAAYACACNWAETYCVTVYVGGIRFYKPINIGSLVKVKATVVYTGSSSIHISVDVYSKKITQKEFVKKTHCLVVFVSVDGDGNPQKVPSWIPSTPKEIESEKYAKKLKGLRVKIEKEMNEFLK